MTTLMDRIKEDWKAARMAGRAEETATLSTMIGECQTREKQANPARVLTDSEVAAIAKKFLKGVEETLSLVHGRFDMTGRTNRLERLDAERSILLRYLPTMLDEPALEIFARAQMAEGVKNPGMIMKALSERHPGAYDGRMASAVAARCLKG